MIHIAIAEDDAACVQQLQQYLAVFSKEYSQELEVSVYGDGQALLDHYHSQFDLLLLDIEMPIMDGMSTAQQIRASDSRVIIVFITNMAQYAIRGYQVDALDYILKPISYFAFSQRLNRAIGRIPSKESYSIIISVRGGSKRLDAKDIYYVESQGHSLIFHTTQGDFITTGTMKDVESKLTKWGFFRCNKGYLVALGHVDGIIDGCAVINGTRLLISRARKNEFMDALTNYISGVKP